MSLADRYANMLVITNDEMDLRAEATESFIPHMLTVLQFGENCHGIAFTDKSLLVSTKNNGVQELVPLADPDEVAAYFVYRSEQDPGFAQLALQTLRKAAEEVSSAQI
jgi:hypothetical protein